MNRALALLRSMARSALRGLVATPVTTAVAVGTLAVTLTLVGAFALLVANMERLLTRFGEDIRVSAYLEKGLPEAEVRALAERVRTAPGVQEVELVTEEEALARFRAGLFGRPSLLEGLEENPLPASLEVTLVPERRDAEGVAVLASALEGLPGIADLGTGGAWVESYARAVGLVRGVAGAIGAVLGFATLLVVSGTIRLAVYARRDELAILRLVGASRAYVALPFVAEGVLQGVVGGLLALALLGGGFVLFGAQAGEGLELLLGHVEPAFLGLRGAATLVAAGAGLGALGSALALLRMGDAS